MLENTKEPLRVLSLFSGCGGMDLGFEGDFSVFKASLNNNVTKWDVTDAGDDRVLLPKTRFQTVFANDIRPYAKKAWTNYFSKKGIDPSVYQLESIVDLVKRRKAGEPTFPSNIDVVTGGFPCQDFSLAGKRQGFNSHKSHDGSVIDDDTPSVESRGQLYMWMRGVIGLVQPKVFIAENVKGLENLGDVKETIERDFASVVDGGYLVLPARVLLAADYGVPQSRERIIFIGLKKSAMTEKALHVLTYNPHDSMYDPYPPRTHSEFEEDGLKPFVKLSEIFKDLEEPDVSKDVDQQKYSKAKYMGSHCQGQIEVNLDGIAPTIRSEHHGNIEFRRLSTDNGGMYKHELDAGKVERRLTIRECARIQTFPDDYAFVQKGVSASSAYRVIGNAVPPLLAYHIAKRLERIWDRLFTA